MEQSNFIKVQQLVLQSSEIVRNGYSAVEKKDSESNIVTDSDKAVQDFLVDGLKDIFPDIGFICEETVGVKSGEQHEFTAVIDPIDGTSNFVRGMNLSAISLAVLQHGKPWLGVVYLPYSDELFAAEAGAGATLNGKPIHVSDRGLSGSCMATAWSLYDKSLAKPCFDICQEIYPHIDDFRRLGSCALELCYLASGRCELFFEARLFPWDIAAASLILQEAGGCYKQLGTYNGDYTRPTSFIAANSEDSLLFLKDIAEKYLPKDLYNRAAFKCFSSESSESHSQTLDISKEEPAHIKKPLSVQIESASNRIAEPHSSDKILAKKTAPER